MHHMYTHRRGKEDLKTKMKLLCRGAVAADDNDDDEWRVQSG